MSASLGIFQQLSLLCQKELSRIEATRRVSLPGRPTNETRIVKSILKDGQNDQSLRVRKRVKFEDVRSKREVPKRHDGDLKNLSETSVALADQARIPDRNNVHQSKKKNYCSVCNILYSSITKFNDHLLTDKHIGVLCCHLCMKKVPYNEMESHLNTDHSTSSPVFKTLNRLDRNHFLCTQCDCTFPQFHLYSKHTQTLEHKGKSCSRCVFRTHSPAEMEEHFKAVHGNQRTQICKLCGAGFTSAPCLERHINSTHSDKRTHVCSSCDAAFNRLDNLHRHEAECHRKGRPFPCNICSMSFKYKRNLVQHMNVHVTNRHQCVICFKSFEDKIDLENHSKVHAGVVFNCMVCGMSFPNYRRREIHLARHLNQFNRKEKKQKKVVTDLKLDHSVCNCDPSPVKQTSHNEHEGQGKCDNLKGEGHQTCVSKTEKPKSCSYSSARNLSLSVPDSGQSTNQSDVLPSRNEVMQNFTFAESRKGSATQNNKNIKKQNVNECAELSEASLKASNLPAEKCDKSPCNVEVGRELPTAVKKEVIVPSSEKNSVSFRECAKTSENLTKKRKRNCLSARKSPVLDIKDDNVCEVVLLKMETPIFSVKNPENVKCTEDVPLGGSTSVTLNKPHTAKRNFANAFENDLKQLPDLELRVKKRKKRAASKENSPVSGMKRVDKVVFNKTAISRHKTGKDSERKVGTNNVGAGLQGSVMPHNVKSEVPRIGSNDSDKTCDSNINNAHESAIFSKALGTEGCQIVEFQGNGWSKNDGTLMELTEDDVIVIDRTCYVPETWCLDALNAAEEALYIDAENVTEMKDLITIPVSRDLTERDPLTGTHTVPDTDIVCVLKTEDVIQNDMLTFSTPEEVLEAPVSYQYEAIETCRKPSPKRRKGKSGPTKRKNAKRTSVKENEVLVKILCTDSDNFCLPEFVIEENSES